MALQRFQRTPSRSGASRMATMCDLPNELILATLSHLTTRQLMPLFSVSTRFNQLAFATFVTRYDLTAVENDHYGLYPESLRGFRCALHLPPIRCITFDCDSPHTTQRDLSDLARFCRRLNEAHGQPAELIIDFKYNVFSYGLPDALKEGIARAIHDLTVSVVGNSGPMVRVTQSGIYMLDPSSAFQPEINRFSTSKPPRTVEQKKQDAENLFLCALFAICIVYLWPTSLPARLICLTAAGFLCAIQFSEQASRYNPLVTTINAFDKVVRVPAVSSLEVLHISKASSGQPVVVCDPASIKNLRMDQPIPSSLPASSAFPFTSASAAPRFLSPPGSPTCSSPTTSHASLTLSDTLSLLSRHSGVTDMVYTSTVIPHPAPAIPSNLLPKLKHLRASPEFISFVHDTPDIFPELEKIEVHVHQRKEPFVRALSHALRKMTSRKNDIHLEVVMPSDVSMNAFAEEALERQREREQSQNMLTGGMDGYGGASLASVGVVSSDSGSEDDGPDFTLPCVKTLSLFWFSRETIGMIPTWVNKFPEVESMTLADVKMTREDRSEMIRGIMRSCPKLSRLTIGAKEKPIMQWLAQ